MIQTKIEFTNFAEIRSVVLEMEQAYRHKFMHFVQ